MFRSISLYLSSSVQLLSHVWFFATPWTAACQASLSITNSWSLPKLMSIELVIPSNRLILCHPLLLLPSIFHSIRVFSNESALHVRWPKDWSFSFNISPSNEHPGLISFRMDWLDLLAVQGTLKSLLQHHSSSAFSFPCSPTLEFGVISTQQMWFKQTIALQLSCGCVKLSRSWVSQMALVVKNLSANAGDIRDTGSIPRLGRSLGEGMAVHSSILAWRIPWTV